MEEKQTWECSTAMVVVPPLAVSRRCNGGRATHERGGRGEANAYSVCQEAES